MSKNREDREELLRYSISIDEKLDEKIREMMEYYSFYSRSAVVRKSLIEMYERMLEHEKNKDVNR